MEFLSRVEELILLAILQLGDDAYGVAIRERVQTVLGRHISVGAVYVPLDRLVNQGLLAATLGEATPARGGKRKRFYRLTAQGIETLAATRRLHEAMWAGAPDLDALARLEAV
jgi:DNA-binding PadR family transcriptional regulator